MPRDLALIQSEIDALEHVQIAFADLETALQGATLQQRRARHFVAGGDNCDVFGCGFGHEELGLED